MTRSILLRFHQKASRQYFLSSYTAFLLAFNIAGILNLIVGDLAGAVMKDLPARSMTPVYILFGLVAAPETARSGASVKARSWALSSPLAKGTGRMSSLRGLPGLSTALPKSAAAIRTKSPIFIAGPFASSAGYQI
jgi:hypothetical protein